MVLGITFVEVGSRPLWALLFALCAFGVADVGSAAGVRTAACAPFSIAAETGTALSVGYPAGSVLVGSSSAKLGALISTAAGPATYATEYGSSVDFGLCTTAVPLPAGSGQQSVQVMLTGLAPQTTYHFAVVATSGTDTAWSGDQTFTTLPAGVIPQGTTINGVAVGGLSEAAALRAVRPRPAAPARLAVGKRHWSVDRAQLGAEIDASRIAAALQALPGQALAAPSSVDAHRLTTYLAAANHRYEQPAGPRLCA